MGTVFRPLTPEVSVEEFVLHLHEHRARFYRARDPERIGGPVRVFGYRPTETDLSQSEVESYLRECGTRVQTYLISCPPMRGRSETRLVPPFVIQRNWEAYVHRWCAAGQEPPQELVPCAFPAHTNATPEE